MIDPARVANSVESVGRDLLAELPVPYKGQVIIVGAAVNTPVLCQARWRITECGAENLDSAADWAADYSQAIFFTRPLPAYMQEQAATR